MIPLEDIRQAINQMFPWKIAAFYGSAAVIGTAILTFASKYSDDKKLAGLARRFGYDPKDRAVRERTIELEVHLRGGNEVSKLVSERVKDGNPLETELRKYYGRVAAGENPETIMNEKSEEESSLADRILGRA